MSILIKVISAQLSRDTEYFSNMDPYCILKLGSETHRTKTKEEAGKKPVWNQSFRLVSPDNNLKVTIMDEDGVSDDMVGEGQVNLSKFRGSSAEQEQIVQLYYNGKAAGKVLMRISGGGNQGGNSFNQGNAWGNTQQNNGWGAQQQNNQWGGMQPQQNNAWGAQNTGWGQNNQNNWGGQNNNNTWGNQNPGMNQPQAQFGNQWGAQGGINNPNQWGGQGAINNPNQQQANMTQFTPILQNVAQWGQQVNNPPPNNQWGNQQPNSQFANQPQPNQPNQPNQWGNNTPPPQQANTNQTGQWGNNQPNTVPQVKPNSEVVYPDLEYKPPINNINQQGAINPNQNSYGSNPTNPNMNVPYQLIGGMQGLFPKQNNNQGGNPYVT